MCKYLPFIWLLLISQSYAIITFQRTYGSGDTHASCAVQTSDGGYIVTGAKQNNVYYYLDVYLMKTDSLGDTLWTKTYGASLTTDMGHCVAVTDDGGYFITGESSIGYPYSEHYVFLLKTDSSGNELWRKSYGGLSDGYDRGRSGVQTNDGGYIIAGEKDCGGGLSDFWLIKTDSYGDTLWTRTFDHGMNDCGYDVTQTFDDDYIAVGYEGNGDVYIVKTDSLGDTLWTKTFGGQALDVGYSVVQLSDGYAVTGFTQSYGSGLRDVFLIRTNPSGDTLWTKTIGGTLHEHGTSIDLTLDSGFIITGFTQSYGAGGDDVYMIKTDSLGDTLWTKTYGGAGDEVGHSVQQTNDGGYIIAATKYNGRNIYIYLIKTDEYGNVGVLETHPPVTVTHNILHIHPNPFTHFTEVRSRRDNNGDDIKVYDITGRVVETIRGSIIGKNLKPGVYFLIGEGYTPVKIVKLK